MQHHSERTAALSAESAKQKLKQALTECSTLPDVNQQAWVMRHAFDAILDEKPAAEQ